MDQLKALKYFVKVVETGSFTKAAEQFSVPPSSLSRRISDLEKSLSASLLKRSTRVVTLTEIGKQYYQQVTDILKSLEITDESVRNYQSTPMGVLNISSTVGFGEKILLPLLDEFSRLYPKITLNVNLTDELTTLARDEVDIAIRGGYAPDEHVIAIKLMDNNFIPVASKAYIDEFGIPEDPLLLKKHRGLFFKTPHGKTPWLCEIKGQWHDVSGEAVLTTNNTDWLLKKALSGEGILMLPRWAMSEYLNAEKLMALSILPKISVTQNPHLGIYLLYQKQRYRVPKLKAGIDFSVARIKALSS